MTRPWLVKVMVMHCTSGLKGNALMGLKLIFASAVRTNGKDAYTYLSYFVMGRKYI